MEWKNKRKGNLTRKILLVVSIILIVSMSVSSVISYIFVSKIVREQAISDEWIRLEQTARQLEVIEADIRNLAVSIAADSIVQQEMANSVKLNAFDRIKRQDTISKRLTFFGGLRLFLYGSFLEMSDGEIFCNVTDYLEAKLATPQIQEYKEHPEWIFSNPYDGIDAWAQQQMVCYRMPIINVYKAKEIKGTLYLEIDRDYLLEPVYQYGLEYENICLIGNQGTVLYQSDGDNKIREILEDYPEKKGNGTHKIREGYLLIKEMDKIGWKMCALVTNSQLWNRTGFVLTFFFLTFAVSLIVILFVISRIFRKVISPVIILSKEMSQNDYRRLNALEVVQTKDEIQTLYECYNEMIAVIHQGIEDRIAYEKKQKQMEFEILLSQIHPHYLYNVLNTVVYLASAGKNKEVVKISQLLIYSLQETLRLGEKNIETDIRNEIRLLDSYLDIQRYRYPNLFEVEIDCKEEYMDYMVPKTILQPLVENAIIHGVLQNDEMGYIYIRMEKMADCFRITVEDDGIGISEEKLMQFQSGSQLVNEEKGRMHIGISNIRERIIYLYGEPYGMKIERRAEKGTRVILELPLPGAEKKL